MTALGRKPARERGTVDCRAGRALTAEEQATLRAEREREQRAREEKQRQVARNSESIWRTVNEAVAAHPYLLKKGVKPHGLKQNGEALIVPLCDIDGKIWSLQTIYPNGDKFFATDGRVIGCFFVIGDWSKAPRILLCEGFATGATLHEATGLPVIMAMNAGNLLPVAKAIRERLPDAELLIAADNDAFKDSSNTGVEKATAAAKAIGAKLAVSEFSKCDRSGKPTDFNDLAALAGLDEVRGQIEVGWNVGIQKESPEEVLQRLAKLPVIAYEAVRENEAKKLKVRIGILDAEVAKRRFLEPKQTTGQGQEVTFEDPELWPERVSGAALLDENAATIRRFVVASDAAVTACALYVLHTYAFDVGDISPILFMTGPTKRVGKSRMLSILRRLVNRPLATSSATAAGLYRSVELFHPTLLIDEVDTFLKENEQLRGLINSGHTRDAAFHLGCVPVGDDFQPRRFSTWCPKILSGIGRLADTIEDRAIIVHMRRRRKGEPTERLRHKIRFEDLRRKCARFIADNIEAIRTADPSIPEELNDRAADNWLQLLALADLAGGEWPRKAREASLRLSGNEGTEPLGCGVQLLADIRRAFDEANCDQLASKDLSERLSGMEGPWAECGKNQKPISPTQLASRLREFGITPRGRRIGANTPRGYGLSDFEDAFSRYLPETGVSKCNSATTLDNIEQNPLFQGATETSYCTSQNATSANKDGPCCTVALQKPDSSPERTTKPERAELFL